MHDTMSDIERPLTFTEKAFAQSTRGFAPRVNSLVSRVKREPVPFEASLDRWSVNRGNRSELELAQELIARQEGFESFDDWHSLHSAAEQSNEAAERSLIAAAVMGNQSRVTYLSQTHEQLLDNSLAVALSLGKREVSQEFSKATVNERIGPLGWHPLTYACCTKLKLFDENFTPSTIDSLLSLGADPNVGHFESETIRGYRTVLGGAIGCREDTGLTMRLLEADVDLHDGPTLYEGCALWYAVELGSVSNLDVLVSVRPPQWHLCHALTHAIFKGEEEMVRKLLGAGADPNWNKTIRGFEGNGLHEAIMDGAPSRVGALLIGFQTSLVQTDAGGRTPLSLAVALNLKDYVSLFRLFGAKMSECSAVDTWVGAVFAHDRRRASDLQKALPDPDEWRYEDHLWLSHAVREKDAVAVRMLLKGGMNPNAIDYDGNTALHRSAFLGDKRSCGALMSAGADPNLVNYRGQAPIDAALLSDKCDQRLLELLGGAQDAKSDLMLSLSDQDAFDEAAGAISAGDLDKLKSICSDRPHFAQARSPRPHRCTLLNYIGVNGFEGERQKTPSNVLEIMDYLIDDLGCDADATSYTYRGGPGNTTVGLLTSSGHPREQGLTLAMTHKLVSAGATVTEGWQLLVDMYEQDLQGALSDFIADLDLASNRVLEAFHESVTLGNLQIAKCLLEAGVDPNSTLYGDVRALHNAAINGDRAMVELLLDKGGDPRLREAQWGGSAVGWAFEGGHDELALWISKRAEAMGEL